MRQQIFLGHILRKNGLKNLTLAELIEVKKVIGNALNKIANTLANVEQRLGEMNKKI